MGLADDLKALLEGATWDLTIYATVPTCHVNTQLEPYKKPHNCLINALDEGTLEEACVNGDLDKITTPFTLECYEVSLANAILSFRCIKKCLHAVANQPSNGQYRIRHYKMEPINKAMTLLSIQGHKIKWSELSEY